MMMSEQSATDRRQISLAYLPPTERQTRSALAWAAIMLIGLAALAPFADDPMPHFDGFIPAIDAIIFVTDLITASLLLAHFSITRSRALLALACGYLFSALIVVAHGLSFPGVVSPSGRLGGDNETTVKLYLFWHLALPVALFVYLWLRGRERTKVVAHSPTLLSATCSVAGVLALVVCTTWIARGKLLIPNVVVGPNSSTPVIPLFVDLTMALCAVALCALLIFRHSALDQWLMVVMLASIVELALTAEFGGPPFTLGFYTGRIFSLVTSTAVLMALLAETTRLSARLARANMLASASETRQALSAEIELPSLIKRLMTIALDNAGADRGLLALPAGDEFVLQAEARAEGNQVEVFMRQEPIAWTGSESVFRDAIRTMETVVLNRASVSILCLPLVKQRQLAGVLLLENTLTSHAFTADRIAVLELLAAQAAISLENTRLYRDVQEREAKVRRLIDSNFIGILIGNLQGHIEEANEAFLRIVGYDQADVEAGLLRRTELTPPEWHGRDAQAVAEMKATGTAQPYEKEYFRKDGSRVPVLVGGATFGEGRCGVVAFIVDLTERKRAEAELAHANRVAIMGQLTASIAHEVSQPVTGLLMNAQTAVRSLARKPPNLEEAAPLIDRIIHDAQRTTEIVRRIRDFSRKAPPRNGVVEVNEVILENIRLTRIAMLDNGISATMQLADGLPCALGDRVQLQQVMLNLIMNAIEAVSEVGEGPRELTIGTSVAEPGNVLVAVSDTGPGLPAESLTRIFEAFYTTKSSGLGMGLSICRSIVEAHGGRLWAEPNEPRGAVFYLMLPSA